MTAPTRLLVLVSLLLTRIITAQMDLGVAATSSPRSRWIRLSPTSESNSLMDIIPDPESQEPDCTGSDPFG